MVNEQPATSNQQRATSNEQPATSNQQRVVSWILLGAIPGLMFCIIPVDGMEFRFSWQLASIWLGGVAFCAFLSSWWLRVFFLFALIRTATMEPVMDAYISLLMIAIFLAAVEGFSRRDKNLIMDAMCIASAVMTTWVFAQGCGDFWPKGNFVGPFNPDAGGVFMALLIPAFFRKDRWQGLPIGIAGVLMAGSTTGFIAAFATCMIALAMKFKSMPKKHSAAMFIVVIVISVIWFWKVDPIQGTINCNRWIAWQHAERSLRCEAFGRGLGSWKIQFPLIASGDARLGSVTNKNGRIVMNSVFAQAHNEYVQTAFELGIHTLALIMIFLAWAAMSVCRGGYAAYVPGGMVALAVSCAGWHVFHIAPLALVGCAWIGIYLRADTASNQAGLSAVGLAG